MEIKLSWKSEDNSEKGVCKFSYYGKEIMIPFDNFKIAYDLNEFIDFVYLQGKLHKQEEIQTLINLSGYVNGLK